MRTTKYQSLVDYLATQTAPALTLSFTQIESIIGTPLPEKMQRNPQMWNGAHHPYVRAWEAAGWAATFDRRNQCVYFTRDEQAHDE